MHPGSIVCCRNRKWVVMPADTDETIVLRPLTGTPEDVVYLHRELMNLVGGTLPFERVTPASFPLPTAEDVSDATGARLLWQAARLTLREGATPLRSLGRISIRPRSVPICASPDGPAPGSRAAVYRRRRWRRQNHRSTADS